MESTQINDNYQQSVSVKATKEQVFDALTTKVGEWWGPVDRMAQQVGETFKIDFDGESYWKFQVVEMPGAQKVVWECIESHQDHNVKGMDEEWTGSKLYWQIFERGQAVEVEFLHQGLVPQGDCYKVCSAAWDFYITDSLKSFLETGEGKPGEK